MYCYFAGTFVVMYVQQVAGTFVGMYGQEVAGTLLEMMQIWSSKTGCMDMTTCLQ
jgi:hypothetical protein